jgi:hypothetical protein
VIFILEKIYSANTFTVCSGKFSQDLDKKKCGILNISQPYRLPRVRDSMRCVGVYSASNINEYQKHANNVSGE